MFSKQTIRKGYIPFEIISTNIFGINFVWVVYTTLFGIILKEYFVITGSIAMIKTLSVGDISSYNNWFCRFAALVKTLE